MGGGAQTKNLKFRDFESGEICERSSEARRLEIHIRVDAGFRTRLKVHEERTEK